MSQCVRLPPAPIEPVQYCLQALLPPAVVAVSSRRGVVAVVAVVALVAATALVGLAGAQSSVGEAKLDVSISENEVSAGERTNLTFNVQNSAIVERGPATEEITTARGVRANISDSGPFEVQNRNIALGSIPDGGVKQPTFQVDVPDDVEPGTYDVEVKVRYEVTNRASTSGSQRLVRTETEEVEVDVVEEPRFEIVDVSTGVQPGTSGDTRVTFENTGSKTAFNSQVTLTSSGGVTIDGGTSETYLGKFPAGESRTVTVEAALAESASGNAKPLEAVFEYENADGIEQPSKSVRRSLSPLAEQSLGFWSLEGDLAVGQDGWVNGSVRNLGPTTLTDAEVVVEPQTDSLQITDSRYALPATEPTETATFAFPTTVDPEADPGPRQVRAHVEYSGANSSGTVSTENFAGRVTVGDSQQFRIEDVNESLSVGFSGEVRGTLVNEGPVPVTDGVLIVEPKSETLFVEDTRYALPEVEPGEETAFRYPVDVSGQADPGPRQARFTVEYQDGDRTLTSDPISKRVVVDDRHQEFSVSGDPTVRAGETTSLNLTITNERDSTLRNIDARLFTSDPLSSGSDEAFVGELDPGESAEIQFDLAASGGAMAKTYPVELDFQYDNARGDEVLSDTYQHPVAVQEPVEREGGGLPLVPIVGLVLVLGGGVVLWRRRQTGRETLNRET